MKLLEFEITEQSVQDVTTDTEITEIFKIQIQLKFKQRHDYTI